MFDGDELTFFFASHMDVTARKRAEEQRFLLQRELAHRVKNTLATVQYVVLRTLRGASAPQDLAEAVSGRLQALARIKDMVVVEGCRSAARFGGLRSSNINCLPCRSAPKPLADHHTVSAEQLRGAKEYVLRRLRRWHAFDGLPIHFLASAVAIGVAVNERLAYFRHASASNSTGSIRAMSDLAKASKIHGLQAQVRCSMQHARSFQVETELPRLMRDKLRELDRVVASRAVISR